MRIFIGGLATETNTFSPLPTGMAAFAEYGIGAAAANSPIAGPVGVFRALAEADGHEVVETICCFAQPGGRTVQPVYGYLRDRILDDLRAAGAVDVVLLMLQGAMVAEACDDCEGELLSRVRELVPSAVIGAELDLHCHLTAEMVTAADLLVICKEYPHVDFDDCAAELYRLGIAAAQGAVKPVAALIDARMIGFYPTFQPPMRDVVAELRALEAEPAIISASLAHGFPWADVADVGTRVLVYADGDEQAASQAAAQVARRLYDARHQLVPHYPDIMTLLSRARDLPGRVVLGNFADNPGCGAAGDSTFFLRAMLELGVSNAAIGAFWDPQVAQICSAAGIGATLAVRLGGKTGPQSGDPVDLSVVVKGIAADHSQGAFGNRQPMGISAWVEAAGIDILICSVRTQVFEPDAFTGLGIPLTDRSLIVVKSSNHYTAGFLPIADHLWHVGSPGAMQVDFGALPYSKRDPNFFPRVDDPWRGAPLP